MGVVCQLVSLGFAYAPGAQGINAYNSRLELGYNNPDSLILGFGAQISQGYGWSSAV